MRDLLRRLRDAVLGPRRPAKRRDDSDAFAAYVVETWRRELDRPNRKDQRLVLLPPDPMDGVQGPDPLPARTLRGAGR